MRDHSSRLLAIVSFVLTTICLFGITTRLCAQTVNGTILGVIKDQQGAVVPRADVSARNKETGALRTAIADDSGNYQIISVPAGSYDVSASAAGFKIEVRSGVVVTVGGDISVNFSLAVGAASEKVEVTGQAPQVDTSSSTMGGFVNSATVAELPLNGRDWLQLALLQPGANILGGQNNAVSNRPSRGNGVAMSISGGRPTDNVYQIDGLIVNDYANASPGSSLQVNLGVDAIREFSVLTSNYSAEYGGAAGGVVNAITKSGTNQIHGSAFYFVRNSVFDARNFFDGATIPPFRRNQYGGSVGGPIKKDKTFFFVNYEKLGELQSLSSAVTTISANARNGILCANSACTETNKITVNPDVLPYLALFPLPNVSVNGNTGIFEFGAAMHGEENYVVSKIDHYFSSTTTLSGSYTYDNTSVLEPDSYDLKLAEVPSRNQRVVLNLQHLFSATVINNIRVGVSRTFAATGLDCCPNNPALTDTSLGFLPGQNFGPIAISGVSGVISGIGAGLGSSGSKTFAQTTPQAYEDLSWIKGRHSLRIGVRFERIDYNVNSLKFPYGYWDFNSVQSFLEGAPSLFNGDAPGTSGVRGERMSEIGAYIQDDFRVSSNFTLNLGIRYEMGTVIKEVNGEIANLRNLTDSQVTLGNPYYNNPTLKDFAPRAGFAWDPFKDGKTAIRGGAGIFDIIPLPYLFPNQIARTTPFYVTGVVADPPASSFPNNILPLLNVNTTEASSVQTNPKTSYRATWNLDIQRQLTKSLALTVGYVGASGVHLAHPIDDTDQVPASLVTFNSAIDAFVFPVPAPGTPKQRINQNFGQIASLQWDGHSSYNALQVNLVQRPVKGLTYQVAYAWSKSIDNGSGTFDEGNESLNSIAGSWAFAPEINRGVSDFDVPQRLVANFQYDLPVPAAMKMHRFANAIFGGWQVGGIYTVQSGSPFTLKIGGDESDTGDSLASGVQGGERPMYVNAPGCSPDAVTGNINNYIMTQCFAFPAPGVLGNLGRNTLRRPVFRDMDFSVFKNQSVWGERVKVQFRAEMFNIFNNVNIQAQTLTLFNGTGALVSTVGEPQGATINTSRQIQFGLKLLF